jgi:hypothetical protein
MLPTIILSKKTESIFIKIKHIFKSNHILTAASKYVIII